MAVPLRVVWDYSPPCPPLTGRNRSLAYQLNDYGLNDGLDNCLEKKAGRSPQGIFCL
jgi:hypothetical protein